MSQSGSEGGFWTPGVHWACSCKSHFGRKVSDHKNSGTSGLEAEVAHELLFVCYFRTPAAALAKLKKGVALRLKIMPMSQSWSAFHPLCPPPRPCWPL